MQDAMCMSCKTKSRRNRSRNSVLIEEDNYNNNSINSNSNNNNSINNNDESTFAGENEVVQKVFQELICTLEVNGELEKQLL